MSRHLKRSSSALSLLLLPALLILCCSSGGTVHAQVNQEPVNPFGGAAPTSLVWEGVTCAEGKVKSVSAPSLVKVNGDVFAVAKVECTKDGGASESVTGIAAMLLPEGGGDVTQISMTGSGNVCVHTLKDNTEGGEKKTVQNIMTPTTVVSGSHIYMLLGTPSQATSSQSSDPSQKDLGLLLVKGEVEESESAKKIKWSNPSKVQYETKKASLTQLAGGGGSGIVMQDNTLAFPMQATKGGKTVFVVVYWSKSENKWKLSKEVEDVEGCSDPAIVEWGEENGFLMVTPCAKGSYDVFRSTYLGNGWLNTDVPLTRVWGTSQKRQGKGVRSGFITATIEGRKVLLVTLPVYSEKGKGQLHLFLTDNAHVYDVGPVSSEGDDAAASNLLYTNDNKLIVVYEKKSSGTSSTTATNLVSVPLTERLEQIKTVVKTWEENDKSLKECKELTGGSPPQQGMCNGPVITKGLVGVLSGTYTADGNEWKDEYLCVNATVKGTVTKTDKGLKFQGSGAGAEWPVGKLVQNQPYYFANNQFTLVATVTIDEVPKEDSSLIPLIGVKMNDTANTALFGVSYNHEKKWVPVLNNVKKSQSDKTWEEGKEYQVALTMDGNGWSVYIDGKEIHGDDEEDEEQNPLHKLFESHRISHFYIGGYGDETSGAAENSRVTVTNVMLYNRLLTTEELRKPVKSKSTIPPPVVGNEPVQQPQEAPQPQPSKPTGAIHSDVSPAPEQAQERLAVQPKEGDNGENKTAVVNGPAAHPEGHRKQDPQNNVDNSERPAAGEEKNPALQVDEKEEDQGEPRIAEGNAEEEGEEERRPDPQLAPATEEENVGAERNTAALPPSDAQQEPKDGVDSNNQPDIAPAPAPVNDAELNNTVKQSGNQGVKPSGPSPRPPWNGNADSAVSMSAPHGFLLLFLGLLVFGIMC